MSANDAVGLLNELLASVELMRAKLTRLQDAAESLAVDKVEDARLMALKFSGEAVNVARDAVSLCSRLERRGE